ncbi:MAG: hypothetical protein AB1757_02095 [Acidobacteriota bacterium]
MDSQIIFALCLVVLFFSFVIWIIITSRRQHKRDEQERTTAGKGETSTNLQK